MRILFSIDLGSGYGQVLRLPPIVKALQAQGHEVAVLTSASQESLAVSYLSQDCTVFSLRSFPTIPLSGNLSWYSILHTAGFGVKAYYDAKCSAMSDILDCMSPDVVVADFSPVALVLAYSRGIPAFNLGYSYTLLPDNLYTSLLPGGGKTAPDRITEMIDKEHKAKYLRASLHSTSLHVGFPDQTAWNPRGYRSCGVLPFSRVGTRIQDWKPATNKIALVYGVALNKVHHLFDSSWSVLYLAPGKEAVNTPNLYVANAFTDLVSLHQDYPISFLMCAGNRGMLDWAHAQAIPFGCLSYSIEHTHNAVLAVRETMAGFCWTESYLAGNPVPAGFLDVHLSKIKENADHYRIKHAELISTDAVANIVTHITKE